MNEEKWLEENLKILRKYNGDGTYIVKECVLKEEYDKLFEENARLKDKIGKAIEYIEWQRDNPQYDNIWRNYECNELLKILKEN